jgi:YHS domain-containing protein
MERDPVCGMEIDPKKSQYVYQYRGKKYYFCSALCMVEFKKRPGNFVKV